MHVEYVHFAGPAQRTLAAKGGIITGEGRDRVLLMLPPDLSVLRHQSDVPRA